MRIFKGAKTYDKKPSVVTIGTFDGVHMGHKAILQKLIKSAKKDKLESVLLTFYPHPRNIVQSVGNLKLINTIEEKENLLEKEGLDSLVIHPFTKEFSRLTAEDYVKDILVNCLNAKKIIIGYDHRFGKNRTADIKDLKEFGEKFGFIVEEISAQELNDVAISSTKIRNALIEGDIDTANTYLGYSYYLTGNVQEGRKIGRQLNYPTANLHIDESVKLIPKNGVYITQVIIDERTHFGITSIGTNPTVDGTEKTIETHILDFNSNLYQKNISVAFLKFIREEKKFDTLNDLKEAIKKDESFARNFIINEKHSL